MIKRRHFLQQSVAALAGLCLPPSLLADIEEQPPGWLTPFGINANGKPKGRILVGYGKTGLATVLATEGAAALARVYHDIEYEAINMPGNNTITATLSARNTPADGTTILEIQSVQFNALPVLYRELPYNPSMDFRPLSLIAEYTLFFTVGPAVDRSVVTMDDYIEWVKKNPEFASVGFTQYGSPGHFAQLILARDRHPGIRGLPYRGTSMLIDDLMDGVLGAAMVISGNRLDLYESGDLRLIATTSRTPYLGWEQIPTCFELGMTEMDIGGWYGWFVHSDTPQHIYDKLRRSVQSIVASQTFHELLQKYALTPSYTADFELYLRLQQEANQYRQLAEEFRLGKV